MDGHDAIASQGDAVAVPVAEYDVEAPSLSLVSTTLRASRATLRPVGCSYLLKIPVELLINIVRLCHQGTQPFRTYSADKKSSLFELSRVNWHIRITCIPLLFKRVRLWAAEDQLYPMLKTIDGASTILGSVKFLTLVTVEKGPKPRVLAPCDPQAPKLLARILGQMGKLREVKLLLSSPSSLGARVRGELRRQKVSLPSTQTLIFGSPGLYPEMSARFIPAVFPNLTTLDLQVGKSLGKTPGLVKTAGLLPELRKLKLCKQSWESHDLHRVADLFPKIRYLLLKGSLKGMRVSTLVPIFKRFSKLRNLVMTVEQYVEVQEQEGEDLTNDDYEFLISDLIQDHHLNEDQAETALEFFKQCPRLYTVCLIREWDANRFVPVVEKGTDEVVGAKVATSWDEEETKYWNSDGWPRISEMD